MWGNFVNSLLFFCASCRWLLGSGGDCVSRSTNQSGGSASLHQMWCQWVRGPSWAGKLSHHIHLLRISYLLSLNKKIFTKLFDTVLESGFSGCFLYFWTISCFKVKVASVKKMLPAEKKPYISRFLLGGIFFYEIQNQEQTCYNIITTEYRTIGWKGVGYDNATHCYFAIR